MHDDVNRALRAFRFAVLTVGFAFVCALSALADYDAGKRAWDAGKPTEALALWRAAADTGDRRAMLEVGRVYRLGLGAPQDYVLAHMWFNLAASRGEMEALKERDALAEKMTPQQVAAAQERARSWRPGDGGEEPASAAVERPVATRKPPPAGPPPPRVIREAQRLLAALGYKPGPADGQWGGRSAKAYGAFLRDGGLTPSGALTPEGLRALRAAARHRRVGTERRSAERAALHRAAAAGDIDGLNGALRAGTDVNARDRQGLTALMHAANKGYVLLVERLLKAGADPDLRAADGATALFMAAVHGHSDAIDLLMKAGADVDIRGPKGKTPSDVARLRYGDAEAARKKKESPAVITLLIGPPGREFRDCPDCPEMVVVGAGEYMMGSPVKESGRDEAEGPPHRVTISRPLAVGKYEVTVAEWNACAAADGCSGGKHGKLAHRGRPVVNVTWNDAKSYVAWLSRRTGKGYRLLSEAEWEYVARAGTTGPFHYGSTISTDLARYDGVNRFDFGPVPVGSFPANDFGLHDTHGNVWEWVEDCWHNNYDGAPADGRAWTSGGDCNMRVLRGGSWFQRARDIRLAVRHSSDSATGDTYSGFRVARSLTP